MPRRPFYLCVVAVAFLAVLTMSSVGCTKQDNPDELREKTAQATATVRQDARAVTEGVKEGWNRDKPLNVNKASKDDLLGLPGIDSRDADHIVAERPYDNTHQLVSRHILSQDEYDKVKDRIVAN